MSPSASNLSPVTQLMVLADALVCLAEDYAQNRISPGHLNTLKGAFDVLVPEALAAIGQAVPRLNALIGLAERAHLAGGYLVFGFTSGIPGTRMWLDEAGEITIQLQNAAERQQSKILETRDQISPGGPKPADVAPQARCLCGSDLGVNSDCGWCRAHYQLGSEEMRRVIDKKRSALGNSAKRSAAAGNQTDDL